MKKFQCTSCGQVFWAQLQFDEILFASGDWIQNPCPKCGAEWAVVEQGVRSTKAREKRRTKLGPTGKSKPRQRKRK